MKARYMLIGIVTLFAVGILVNSSYARIDPDSIVAMWLFDNDEDDVLIDASENGYDAMLFGNVEWVEGRYGEALKLDGSTYADVDQEKSEAFNLSTYTIAVWIGEKEVAGHQFILHKSTGNTDRTYIMNVQDATGLFVSGFCNADDQVWRSVVSKTKVADGDWHHLAATYDDEKFRIYVDGVLENEPALAGPPAMNDAPFRIGGGAATSMRFIGVIDEILVANVAFDEADIKAIMNEGLEKAAGLTAVSAAGKLGTTWGDVKVQY